MPSFDITSPRAMPAPLTTPARRPSRSTARPQFEFAPSPPSPPPRVYIPPTIKDVPTPAPSLPVSRRPSASDLANMGSDSMISMGLDIEMAAWPSLNESRRGSREGLANLALKPTASDESLSGSPYRLATHDSTPSSTDAHGRTADPDSEPGERQVFTLKPADRGRDAWLFLFAATLVEMCVWGLPFSIGVLHVHWAKMFPDAESTITLAATLQTGLIYMSAAVLGPLFAAVPHRTRMIQAIGVVVTSAGLLGAGFATKPYHLIVTIGIMYSFAGALYLPCATLIYEWFNERRGLATGIMFGGTGLGGTIFPFIVSALLDRFGYRATMICVALGFFAICSIALCFVKNRVPVGRPRRGERRPRPKVDMSFLRRRSFYAAAAVMLLSSMGGFIPSLWIPSFTEAVGAYHPGGTGLVAIMNAASVPGNSLSGYLSDRMAPSIVIFSILALSSIGCLALWGFATVNGLLVVFAVVWGLTSLSLSGIWSRVITVISKDDPTLAPLMFAFFTMLKGVANLTSGPISSGLLAAGKGSFQNAAGAYGATNYGVLIIYSGVTCFAGAMAGVVFPSK